MKESQRCATYFINLPFIRTEFVRIFHRYTPGLPISGFLQEYASPVGKLYLCFRGFGIITLNHGLSCSVALAIGS